MCTSVKRTSNKSRLLWITAALIAIGVIGGYFYLHPESLPDWATKTSIGRELQTTTVYKWQDESGNWHVTDQPPPADIDYQVERYDRDTNVMPLTPKPDQ